MRWINGAEAVIPIADSLVTHLYQPAFKGADLGLWDELDVAKQAFGVGRIHPLCAACYRNTKGGG